MAGKTLVATETFWTQQEVGVDPETGEPVFEDKLFIAGVTKVRADHPVVKGKGRYFEPVEETPPTVERQRGA
jgi:hypothetical protein